MARPIRSSKSTPAINRKLLADVAEIKAHYADVLSSWDQCTDSQKKFFLDNSPILYDLLQWSLQWLQ